MAKKFTLLVGIFLQLQATAWAADSSFKKTKFKKFSSLREAITAKIANAERRVWLASEFLSDFDIALMLYVAKHRQLDVRVVLSEERVNDFLSQYDYLARHGVAIQTIAAKDIRTQVVCDNELLVVDGDLDFLAERKFFSLRLVSVASDAEPAAGKLLALFNREFDNRLSGGGVAYDYTRKVHRRPNDVARTLPSKTIANQTKTNIE
ncbi:MAG: hypothetical protein OYH77_03280 [Pseudomonadota bacterium]|nr:hypothetical protein [Pseudomonadota bacterium]